MTYTMIKILCLSLVLAIGDSCTRYNAELPATKPEKVGMSSARLNRIKPLMQKYVDEGKLPGMITMVARHGKVVSFEKFGVMDVNKPMQFNTIFRIASMTKPITGVAVMILYEEGYFQLDDPVAKYIPEFENLKVYSSQDKNGIHLVDQIRPMTIRDLLTHTSGLASGGENNPVDSMYRSANLSDGTLKDMIHKLSEIPLLYHPGSRWNYSRSSDVLGYLVEVVSGKPFDVFLKERIFMPLKMNDTDYYVPEANIQRVSAVYGLADPVGIKVIMKPDTNEVSLPVKFLSGNGGLMSTATDYMIFSQMLLNKGEYNGIRILGRKTVELMTSNHITNETMPDDDFFGPLLSGMGFGFGFAVVQENIQPDLIGSIGSYWWSGAANTYFYIDPKEELIFILMTQFVPNLYYPVFKEFRELGYQAIVK
jgi:CubicO group peptidase (beta-lactamase class C family)